jgi:hypothetical protein
MVRTNDPSRRDPSCARMSVRQSANKKVVTTKVSKTQMAYSRRMYIRDLTRGHKDLDKFLG